jgi:hypothetical protein
VSDDGAVALWTGEHDGYKGLRPPASHRRTVRLDRPARAVEIVDEVGGAGRQVQLAFHFGPDVHAALRESTVALSWSDGTASAASGAARLELSPELRWSLHRGETDPILGWYSRGLGRRTPAFTLLGRGQAVAGQPLTTKLVFLELAKSDGPALSRRPVSLTTSESDDAPAEAPWSQAEAR